MTQNSTRDIVVGNGSAREVKPGVWSYRFSLGKDLVTGKCAYSTRRTIHTRSKLYSVK